MLTYILMVVAGIVLFVVLGVLGWLGTAIDAVFSLLTVLTEGVGNCFGCVIELVLMLVVLGLIISAISLIL